MFSSIRSRLWLSYAALIVAALGVVTIVLGIFLLRNPYLYRQTYLKLTAAQGLLMSTPLTPPRVDAVAEAFGVRVLVFDGGGNPVQDSSPAKPPLRAGPSVLAGRALSLTRDETGRVWFFSKSRLGDGRWLLVAAPRPKLLPVLGLLTDELSRPIVQGGLIALLLSLVLAYLLARWIGDPLQKLVAAAHSVSLPATAGSPVAKTSQAKNQGELQQVTESGPREVRELTQAFNAMIARVESSQSSQRDFVANVSHELKTPLTSIQGFAQALLDGTVQSDEARRQAAQVIYDEAGRMHRMALDLLELARLDAGTADLKMSEIDVAGLLQGILDRFRPMAASAGVHMHASIEPNLPNLRGDGDRLAQVFTNLVDNALKFTPREGTIELSARAEGNEVEIAVRDSGPGIAEADLPHVFERFFQADESRSGGEKHGAGLGLAIAREITLAHGGRISARSERGQGAGFFVRLPVVSAHRG